MNGAPKSYRARAGGLCDPVLRRPVGRDRLRELHRSRVQIQTAVWRFPHGGSCQVVPCRPCAARDLIRASKISDFHLGALRARSAGPSLVCVPASHFPPIGLTLIFHRGHLAHVRAFMGRAARFAWAFIAAAMQKGPLWRAGINHHKFADPSAQPTASPTRTSGRSRNDTKYDCVEATNPVVISRRTRRLRILLLPPLL